MRNRAVDSLAIPSSQELVRPAEQYRAFPFIQKPPPKRNRPSRRYNGVPDEGRTPSRTIKRIALCPILCPGRPMDSHQTAGKNKNTVSSSPVPCTSFVALCKSETRRVNSHNLSDIIVKLCTMSDRRSIPFSGYIHTSTYFFRVHKLVKCV